MERRHFSTFILYLLLLLSSVTAFSSEENFLCINGVTNEILVEFGPHIDELITPCSTFKIVLSLMGYDSEVLKDETTPVWDFQEGYDDYLESWKASQTPQSWMRYSCIWYSRVLAKQLGLEKMQYYLTSFGYGNLDMSGGLTTAWINSSLKISVTGQVDFLQKMINRQLLISSKAVEMTRSLLLVDTLPGGWKLYGKTGWSGRNEILTVGWFVGWVEKDDLFLPFAYQILDPELAPSQRIPRVKQLLFESNILTTSF